MKSKIILIAIRQPATKSAKEMILPYGMFFKKVKILSNILISP